MKKIERTIKKWLILVVLGIIPLASAGIVYPYYENNTMIMHPGESKEITFKLNNVEEDATKIAISIISGKEVVSMPQNEFIIQGKQSEKAMAIIQIPENPEKRYALAFQFKENPLNASGGISLGVSSQIGYKIDVETSEDGSPSKSNAGMLIAGTIILAIILWILSKKKIIPWLKIRAS